MRRIRPRLQFGKKVPLEKESIQIWRMRQQSEFPLRNKPKSMHLNHNHLLCIQFDSGSSSTLAAAARTRYLFFRAFFLSLLNKNISAAQFIFGVEVLSISVLKTIWFWLISVKEAKKCKAWTFWFSWQFVLFFARQFQWNKTKNKKKMKKTK